MTRFVITLTQGVNMVLSSLGMMEGGELFVPKIPSVRMTDVAEAMLPGCETRIVGIRPGEKLHEVMITDDDSRATLELSDRFVIEPTFEFWSRRSYTARGAVPVQEMFRYASDSNTEWLGVEDIRALLKQEEYRNS